MHRGRESTRGVARNAEGVLAVLERMVARSCAVGAARVTRVRALGCRAGSRTQLGGLVVDGLLRLLRGERSRRDGRGRVYGLAKVELGRRGRSRLRGFRQVGRWSCTWMERLETLGRIKRDAEVSREGWAERRRAGFRVDLKEGGVSMRGIYKKEILMNTGSPECQATRNSPNLAERRCRRSCIVARALAGIWPPALKSEMFVHARRFFAR